MILITKDSRSKIRVVNVTAGFDKTNNAYVIKRITGLFGGKQTDQPEVIITKGKANRTLKQQAKLEFESYVKKYLDKGYKNYESLTDISFEHISQSQIEELIASAKTDISGCIKPMLAKDHNKIATDSFEIDWLGSRKIDGVRCLMYYDPEKKYVCTASRGGGDYFASTLHITTDPKIDTFFKENPTIILDGELYKHGLTLQKLSGLARREDSSRECLILEYWVYDYFDGDQPCLPFEDRKENLYWWANEYFSINVDDDWNPNKESIIKFVPHRKVSGFAAVDLNHDRYIKEGFEGIVIRNPEKEYGIGKRDNRMIKYKKYMDEEFEITGMEDGLRDEDMVFTCITKAGKEFKAKPMGTRELKDQYRADINSIIGKKATVKFFYYSDDDIPLQPVLKSIRDYD